MSAGDRSNTAKIGVHRHSFFSFYFGPDCELLIDGIDRYVVGDTSPVEFNFDTCEATFSGMELSPGRWIVGMVTPLPHTGVRQTVKLTATADEIRYVLAVAKHMFGGDEPVEVQ